MTVKKGIKKIQRIVVAKEKDGTIQMTFTIPIKDINREAEKVLKEFAEKMEIPGFRKGNAPMSKVKENVSKNELIEHTLSHILPGYLAEALKEHKLKIAIYPKFQVLKSEADQDWQIRAMTAELPEIKLGKYKETIKGELSTTKIWTPEKGSPKDQKEPTKANKEQLVINTLLKEVNLSVPKIIVDEEVNNRLSGLLQRVEQLGLSLDAYLSSMGKTADTLRAEYEKQAEEAIALDLILNEIAKEEKITVTDAEVKDSLEQIKKTNPNLPEDAIKQQERTLKAIARKRKTLEKLTSLV